VCAVEDAVSDAEADRLFAQFVIEPALVLAVSGGPDSTALMLLAARWCKRHKLTTRLLAVTVDHGLRREARGEAVAVKRLAAELGIAHRTRRWIGPKPTTGLQERARYARYRILHAEARAAKARFVLTAHTLDDQAETVLLRLARGSGMAGIAGMAREVHFSELLAGGFVLPGGSRPNGTASGAPVSLARPLLQIAKKRLIATLHEAGLAYAEDPSNADPRFARVRLRRLLPALAAEGLTVDRLDRLARRVQRGEAALKQTTEAAAERFGFATESRAIAMPGRDWLELPAEIALRLLGRAIDRLGNEGPVELGKLEAFSEALARAVADSTDRFRRTLAGAMVTLKKGTIVIECAPPRRRPSWGHRPPTG
jgi:tRNA(Ile)-lysidine synthase